MQRRAGGRGGRRDREIIRDCEIVVKERGKSEREKREVKREGKERGKREREKREKE